MYNNNFIKIDIKEYIALPYRNDYHNDEIVRVKYSGVKKIVEVKERDRTVLRKKCKSGRKG